MDTKRFIKTLSLTTSSFDGECLNAIRLCNDTLKKDNLTWEMFLNKNNFFSGNETELSLLQATNRELEKKIFLFEKLSESKTNQINLLVHENIELSLKISRFEETIDILKTEISKSKEQKQTKNKDKKIVSDKKPIQKVLYDFKSNKTKKRKETKSKSKSGYHRPDRC